MFKLLQETEPYHFKVVDEDREYERLYRRINNPEYQEGDKELLIVEIKYIFKPSKIKQDGN